MSRRNISVLMPLWRGETLFHGLQNKDVLRNAGSSSNKEIEAHVLAVYEQFDQRRKQADAQPANQVDDEELKLLEQQITIGK